MQKEPKTTPLETLLAQLKEKMSANSLFDSSVVLTIIQIFETEKITLRELFSVEKLSIGGIIEQVTQLILKNRPQDMNSKMKNILVGRPS